MGPPARPTGRLEPWADAGVTSCASTNNFHDQNLNADVIIDLDVADGWPDVVVLKTETNRVHDDADATSPKCTCRKHIYGTIEYRDRRVRSWRQENEVLDRRIRSVCGLEDKEHKFKSASLDLISI